jgi:hypothetical protein
MGRKSDGARAAPPPNRADGEGTARGAGERNVQFAQESGNLMIAATRAAKSRDANAGRPDGVSAA